MRKIFLGVALVFVSTGAMAQSAAPSGDAKAGLARFQHIWLLYLPRHHRPGHVARRTAPQRGRMRLPGAARAIAHAALRDARLYRGADFRIRRSRTSTPISPRFRKRPIRNDWSAAVMRVAARCAARDSVSRRRRSVRFGRGRFVDRVRRLHFSQLYHSASAIPRRTLPTGRILAREDAVRRSALQKFWAQLDAINPARHTENGKLAEETLARRTAAHDRFIQSQVIEYGCDWLDGKVFPPAPRP